MATKLPPQNQLDKRLWWAAVEGNVESVTQLLKEGANPNNGKLLFLIKNRMYACYTPLHMSCMYKHPEVVKLLLANKANPNVQTEDSNFTPLQCACVSGSLSCVQMLVEAGCDTEVRDDLNKTPIEYAVTNGHLHIVDYLSTHTGMPNINSQPASVQEVGEGKDIGLRVTAIGAKPLTYQWTRNGKKLQDSIHYNGSCTDSLLIKQAHIGVMGQYCCTVSNRTGEVVTVPTDLNIDGLKFSNTFNCDELCLWLKYNKLSSEDIKIFREQDIDGEAFLTLPFDRKTFKDELGCVLTFGGWRKLIKLKEADEASDAEQIHQHGPPSWEIRGESILKSSADLRWVRRAVWEARSQWKDIGRAFELSEGTVCAIHEDTDGEALHTVIKLWMELGRATIYTLLKALEDQVVSRCDIAQEIRDQLRIKEVITSSDSVHQLSEKSLS